MVSETPPLCEIVLDGDSDQSSLFLPQINTAQLNSIVSGSASLCCRGARGGAEWRCVDFELGRGRHPTEEQRAAWGRLAHVR